MRNIRLNKSEHLHFVIIIFVSNSNNTVLMELYTVHIISVKILQGITE